MITLALLAMLTAVLAGCRTTYVPVETVRTQYVGKTDTVVRQDSVVTHDSVSVYIKGDTVYTTKTAYRDRLRYVYKALTDTVHATDTIVKMVTVERQKKATFIEQLRQSAGDTAIVIVLIALLALILKKTS